MFGRDLNVSFNHPERLRSKENLEAAIRDMRTNIPLNYIQAFICQYQEEFTEFSSLKVIPRSIKVGQSLESVLDFEE